MFIACQGYPKCKNTMQLPKSLLNATVQTGSCMTCLTKQKKDVKPFLLQFKPEVIDDKISEFLPYEHKTAGKFCVVPGCDPNF